MIKNKKLFSILGIITIMAGFSITGCSNKLATSESMLNSLLNLQTIFISDNTPPTVTTTAPRNGDNDVPINSGISVIFSEAMDGQTITVASIMVTDTATALPIAGTVTATGSSAVFTPLANLDYLTSYTVTVRNTVADLGGNALEADYTWSFTTGAATDTSAPIILMTIPHNNDTSIPMNTVSVLVIFNEYVNPATINDANVYLYDITAPATHIPATLAVDGNTVIIHATLASGIQYVGVVTTGVTDLASPTPNSLPADYTWTFRTISAMDLTTPTVAFTRPAGGATGIPLNTIPMIFFSEAIDPSSLTGAGMTDAGGTPVPGYPIHLGNTICYKPSADLAPYTLYTITIPGTAADLAGNFLGAAYSWSFQTGAAIDTTPPQVTAVSPVNGATSVSTGIPVTVSFNEEIMPLSVNDLTFVLLEGTNCSPATPCPRVNGTITRTMTSATLTVGLLNTNTTYTAIVGNVMDLAGNHMAVNYLWTFTTGNF